MSLKLDNWESYTDAVGRRHWRWPPTERQDINPRAESGPRQKIGVPQPPLPRRSPARPNNK